MENSLFKVYNDVHRSYYDILVNTEELFKQGIADLRCYSFIDRHFQKGTKEKAFDIPFFKKYSSDGKHTHTVSLYLMGLVVEQVFDHILKDTMSEFIEDLDAWYDFKYTWFLTCLYHDAASCIEKGNDLIPDSLDAYLSLNRIQHVPEKKKKVPLRFQHEIISAYYVYRKEDKSLEHGITAGYLLYDRLVKNFQNKTQNVKWKNDSWIDSQQHKMWRLTHLDHFAYIADAIICHNIWLCTDKNDEDKYKKYGLEQLIVKNEQDKLSAHEYPLQFILCLLDTVEPVKRFCELPPDVVLRNISLNRTDENTLILKWTDLIKAQRVFLKWLSTIRDMELWMRVKVSACKREGDECFVEINIL